ncbi:MAG: hypothetical protein ACYDCK_01455 [Thermoplasmatota archaeon]
MGVQDQLPYIDLTVTCDTCGTMLLTIEQARFPPDGYTVTCKNDGTTYDVANGVATKRT